MKKEIVYTDKYLLVVDNLRDKLIIAHLPLSDAPILEGVPLLPPLSQGDNVEELAESTFGTDIDSIRGSQEYDLNKDLKTGFVRGYNKAKEKYKYTEEDLKLAMNYGYVQGDTGFQGVANLDDLLDLIHRKIKKSSRPTHFECEMEITHEGNGTYSTDLMDIGVSNLVPINIPKTITNSQGQIELVGKYLNL
jgi:hypothetical protein